MMKEIEAKQHYEKAQQQYREKHFEEALEILDKLDRAFPLDKSVQYLRARTLSALGRKEEALELAELGDLLSDPGATKLKAKLESHSDASAKTTRGCTSEQDLLELRVDGSVEPFRECRPVVRNFVGVALYCVLGALLTTCAVIMAVNSGVPVPLSAGVVCFVVFAALFILLYRKYIVLDRRQGTLTFSKGLLTVWRVRSCRLSDIRRMKVLIGNKRKGDGPDGGPTTLLIEMNFGTSMRIPLWGHERTSRIAEAIGRFLSLEVEYQNESDTLEGRKLDARLYRGMAAGLAVLLAVFVAVNDYFLLKDETERSQYRYDKVVSLPCKIVTMKIEKGYVDVLFRYAFDGQEYESTRYAPVSNRVTGRIAALAAGNETVCYVNPNWPNKAVLSLPEGSRTTAFVTLNVVLLGLIAVCFTVAVYQHIRIPHIKPESFFEP